MSTLKSQMLPEKYRTTIMNFFRIPINIFSILSLIGTKYMTTYQICLLCFGFMALSVGFNIYLIKVHTPPDATKREIKKTSEFQDAYIRSKNLANSAFAKDIKI
jgi:hypothetical protein